MTTTVLEVVEFRITGDHDALREAARGMETWLRAQPGFRWRRLCVLDDGACLECIEWADMASAKAAAETIMKEPSAGPMMAMIDGASVVMRHWHVLVSV